MKFADLDELFIERAARRAAARRVVAVVEDEPPGDVEYEEGRRTRVPTQQQFGHEADVNTIVKRFGITGGLPPVDRQAFYGDFTGVHDYASAVERLQGIEDAFMALPADVRERFGNDPGRLVEYAARATPEQLDELNIRPDVPVVPGARVAPEAEAGGQVQPVQPVPPKAE